MQYLSEFLAVAAIHLLAVMSPGPDFILISRNSLVYSRKVGIFSAIRMGFLTNVLNPKASLFFFALFTQVISTSTPKFIQVLYGTEMALMTFVWFAAVSLLLSHSLIKTRFTKIQHYVERSFGVILIGLGIKVALSSK